MTGPALALPAIRPRPFLEGTIHDRQTSNRQISDTTRLLPGDAPMSGPIELLVCTTCRRGQQPEADRPVAGARLHAALSEQSLPPRVALRAVECLSNCSQGCSIVLRGSGRWTYVYGNLSETDDIESIVDGAARYLHTDDGIVPWRERPATFRKNCIARIPPLEAADD